MSIKKAADCVKKYKNFLITSHTSLEGDALGSELAFSRMLKKLGKTATIINEDKLPPEYDFLPGNNSIKRFKKGMKGVSFDCFVALDCSDFRRTGEVYTINADNKPSLNIDHHISNERFAGTNWVDPSASSCSEMIYKLYKYLGVPLDKDAAISLYTGMLTDTGSFHYSNTAVSTHKAVSELLRYGLDIHKIYKSVYENITLEDARLLGRILPRMRISSGGKIAWFEVGQNILRRRNPPFDLTERMLSFARSVRGVEVVALFKENLGMKNEIRINLRSQGKVDVNKVARFFGGGGHKAASGATVRGKIGQIRRKILAKIEEELT
ncbi:MAG: bifunctional oligoribonuclease/PAP phosphatase NrnA [Candidatus Omnitrophota bacterium]